MSVHPHALAVESPYYFLGRLSMAVALQVKGGAHEGREALEEFLASPVPTPELRDMLRKEMKR